MIFTTSISAFLLSVLGTPAAAQHRASGMHPAVATQQASQRLPGVAGIVTVHGVVEANYTWPLVAPAPGWVKQVFFSPGDYVRNRQVLLKFMYNPAYTSQLNREYILAPRAGIIVKRNVEVGARVRAGMCVALVQDVSQVKVVVLVSPRIGQAVRVCDPAVVRVAELPGRAFAGVVEAIRELPSARPGTQIIVEVQNAVPPRIRPLMHASVLLDVRPAAPFMARQ